ncbi:MAG: hypothetical protein FD138_3120 [Planctomycetota bacterium]|nr:MAG: hypothetical protein FD138_3120 [Planctomycetota bacterium]
MKIKTTLWIACIVIPLALVVLLMRSQVVRMATAQDAEKRTAVVAPADKPMVDSSAPQRPSTVLSKPDVARDESAIDPDLEASAPPAAVTDKELAILADDPLVEKSGDNAPPNCVSRMFPSKSKRRKFISRKPTA